MNRNYERLAWTVLLISFAICVILIVGVPVSVQLYVHSAQSGQLISLDMQEGNALVTCPGADVPIAVVSRQDDLCQGRENILIDVGPANQGQLSIRSRSSLTSTLASVQIYRGTRLYLQQATTARFPRLSAEPDHVVLKMDSGRIRVTVPSRLTRPMLMQVTTPQALVQLTEGSTAVEVTDQETQATVREGEALVLTAGGKSVARVRSAERVVVPTSGEATGVMSAERNLLAGYSEFREPLGSIWKVYTLPPQIPGESPGEATNVSVENRQAADFSRAGVGFAETGIKQDVNRDIRDFNSLQLRLVLRVLQQDVPLCGTAGTECPVMVRLDYVDDNGEARFWEQGFYFMPDPNNVNPEFCNTCNPRNIHRQTVPGIWYTYESENLIPILARVGAPPVLIKSISIYASGHTYQSQVAEVELLGQE
jgi:hypothetical protein